MLSGEEPLKAKQPSNGEFFEPSSHAQAAKIQSQEGVSIPQCSENFASAGLHKPNKASGQPLHSGWGGSASPPGHPERPAPLPLSHWLGPQQPRNLKHHVGADAPGSPTSQGELGGAAATR